MKKTKNKSVKKTTKKEYGIIKKIALIFKKNENKKSS